MGHQVTMGNSPYSDNTKIPMQGGHIIMEDNQVAYKTFRDYTDCLYSSYGTKWNGNAAAYNGSLYVVQDDNIRRLSPLECERLMGFPDNFTNIPWKGKPSPPDGRRYKVLGNSMAVPVMRWIGRRIEKALDCGGDVW
jgi:DNA (cytosine-5)-methyltransferase 1